MLYNRKTKGKFKSAFISEKSSVPPMTSSFKKGQPQWNLPVLAMLRSVFVLDRIISASDDKNPLPLKKKYIL